MVESYNYSFNDHYGLVASNFSGNKLNVFLELFKELTRTEVTIIVNFVSISRMLRKVVDLCQFLKNPRSDVFVNLLYQEFLNRGLKVLKCPLQPVKIILIFTFMIDS